MIGFGSTILRPSAGTKRRLVLRNGLLFARATTAPSSLLRNVKPEQWLSSHTANTSLIAQAQVAMRAQISPPILILISFPLQQLPE